VHMYHVIKDNGSSNNLRCYLSDRHQSHNAVHWRTGGISY